MIWASISIQEKIRKNSSGRTNFSFYFITEEH